MGKRRVDLHRFKRYRALLFLRLRTERAHIVQAVAELDEDDTDILRHREQHLAQVFDVLLFLVLDRERHYFCKSVNEHGNGRTELL